MADASLSFLPWLRRGFGTSLAPGLVAGPRALMHVDVVTDRGTGSVTVPIAGPGDVVGIDARTVVRIVPGANESDAEFGHFAAIEFDQADLPWRYTPASPPANNQLKPWIALLVLGDDECKQTPPSASQKLPLVSITNPDALPVLDDSWAWAHIQSTGPGDVPSVTSAVTSAPGTVVARIVCPRALKAQTAYTVFLVPTFLRGVQAGTGVEPTANANDPAWTNGQAGVVLPVYYQWRFITGVVGTFTDLVTAVKPAKLGETVGRRQLDVSAPGFTLANAATVPQDGTPQGTTLEVEGALQSAVAERDPEAPAFLTSLEALLTAGTVSGKRVVLPPLYGQWYATETTLGASTNPPWLVDLDGDPRERTAAALGTAVVQANQESLLNGAWDQVGNVLNINAQRRILQAGREAFLRAFTRHVTSGGLDSFLGLTGWLHSQVPSAVVGQTVFGQIAASRIGRDLLDPQWRRFSGPRGLIGRRLGLPTSPVTGPGPIERINNSGFQPAPEPKTPTGMATPALAFADATPGSFTSGELDTLMGHSSDQRLFWGILLFCVARKQLLGPVSPTWSTWWLLRIMRLGLELIQLANGRTGSDFSVALRDGTATSTTLANLPKTSYTSPPPSFTSPFNDIPTSLPPIPAPATNDTVDAARFRTAMGAVFDVLRASGVALPNPPALDLRALRTLLTAALDPGKTLAASMQRRVKLFAPFAATDTLEPFVVGPELPQPMWAPLRDLSIEWIVPGMSGVQNNTLGALVPNQRFIEAYMVGLNHEMSRELLWNEYPCDQRATVFRQFWDTRGYVLAPNEILNAEQFRDINPINQWPRANHLGQNSPRRTSPANTLVLLLRADLVRRYPNVVVYAVQSPTAAFPTTPQTEMFPIFSAPLSSDTFFYSFELSVSEAQGTSPHWFFLLQEHPSEPRFEPKTAAPDLTSGYIRPATIGAVDAAQFATLTFRTPKRVAVPGAALIPSP